MKTYTERTIFLLSTTRVSSNQTALYSIVMLGICCLLSCQLAASAAGQNLPIYTINEQYSTHVDASGDLPEMSRTTVSSSPFSDSIEMPRTVSGPYGPVTITTHADASAGLFNVSSYAGWGRANAIATNQICFLPIADQTQTLGIDIYAPAVHGAPAGSLLLLDLSSNSTVWNFNWGLWQGGTYLGFYSGGMQDGVNFDVATDFLATDEYELTIATWANAADDTATSQVQITGLEVVPKPSSVHLLPLAWLALPALRRARRRTCADEADRGRI